MLDWRRRHNRFVRFEMCKEIATKHPGRDTQYFSERITRIFSLLRPAHQLIPRHEVQMRKAF